MCGSRLTARARTTTATYDTQNVMWAIEIWASEPRAEKTWAKNSSRLMPRMISGATIGRMISVSARPPTLRLRSRASPSPSSVPSTVATSTATSATRIVFSSASSMSSLANRIGYQSSVKPVHAKLSSESLKLNTMRMTIGRNRNA